MIHNHWPRITLCWASDCESWCAMLSQWLCIILCYAGQVVVNHDVLFCASGCESWCVMLSKWLWIMVFSKTHHDSQPLAQHYTPWFTITCSGLHTIIYIHWFSITHDNSHPLAQYYIPSMMSQWVWIMVCYAEPVVVNHGLLCCTKGCELWRLILSQWLWIMVCTCSALFTMIHNQFLRITHHDSQSLAQDYTPWFTTTGSA
jgi:hypothetical protein